MAKKKVQGSRLKVQNVPAAEALPDDFGDFGPDEPTQIGVDVSDTATEIEPAPPSVRTVSIEAFLAADIGEGYVSRHADCRLTSKQSVILRRLWRGLNQRHERTENGKHVEDLVDAIRWLLERIGFAEEEATDGSK
jgi:hypothetical protein